MRDRPGGGDGVTTVTVSAAKATLSRLVQRALDGETIAIGRRGEPEVVLTALRHDPTPRQLGTILTDEKGDPVRIDDDVDQPMSDVADAFEDSRVFPHP